MQVRQKTTYMERTFEQVEVSVLRDYYDCGTNMKRLQYDNTTTVHECCTTVLLPQGAIVLRLLYDYACTTTAARLWKTVIRQQRDSDIAAVTNLLTDVTALTNVPFVTSSKFKLSLQFTLCKERFSFK